MAKAFDVPAGVVVRGPYHSEFETILTYDALQFLAEIQREFGPTRIELLKRREKRQAELDSGKNPNFHESTAWIRESDWSGASIPADLLDRRVEITGPVDRKMIINALNSGAKVFMADFEDSNCPTWQSNVEGQINLRDAINRTITFSQAGKSYKLKDKGLATLMVRPRGWHLIEAHVTVDGQPVSGSLFDFALYFFHNAKTLLLQGSGPYFYLPKMESHLEARLWNEVFVAAQKKLGIPRGTIRATVLIETILAAFEMDEIIYELREHSAGLNCGRWDYIFSYIKKFRSRKECVLPDRATVGMDRPFMDAYVRLLIKTCHRRRVHAMGGMAAQIPIKDSPAANQAAMEKVAKDKLREVKAGHDGTWVAHPGLMSIALNVFNEHMKTPNQLDVLRGDVHVTAKDLLYVGDKGEITEAGLRGNIGVGLAYLEAWLGGTGCVPIHNLMEDAATAEISRSQIWQWIRHGASLNTGKQITKDLVSDYLKQHVAQLQKEIGQEKYKSSQYPLAVEIFGKLCLSDKLAEFLTLEAYPHIVTIADGGKLKAKL